MKAVFAAPPKINAATGGPVKQLIKSDSGLLLQDNRPVSAMKKKQVDALAEGRPVQRIPNKTGLPDQLKSGIENLSGHSMDDVKVHYNSAKPTQLNAHAYAQGTDIHIASGQEKHLPHEAWHVVQQKQGRVKPTIQMKARVNDGKETLGTQTVQRSIFNKLIGNNVSDLVTLVGGQMLGIGGPTAVNIPAYGPKTGRGFGTYIDVNLLNPPAGTATGTGNDNATWVALKKRRIKTNTYYVQAHLLSQKLGGSGTDWNNLVPLTQAGNGDMERKIESNVKLAAGQGKNVRYKIQAFYGQWPWQWPAYCVNMLTATWIPHILPDLYSSLVALRDAEQHVPSALYAQWWVVGGEGSWIPFVKRVGQKANSNTGFWIETNGRVLDMNRANAIWQLAEQTVASLLMSMILPRLLTSHGITEQMAKALRPTQLLEAFTGVNIGQWMYGHLYDLDAFFIKYVDESLINKIADVITLSVGPGFTIHTGKSHSANREEVSMYEGINKIDAPTINALPAHTTKSGKSFG